MRLAVALACIPLLAACGGDDVASARDVADLIGCTDVQDAEVSELFVTEQVYCEVKDEPVTVYYFAASDDLEQWRAFPGGRVLYGDGWAVAATRPTLDALQAKVGGEVA